MRHHLGLILGGALFSPTFAQNLVANPFATGLEQPIAVVQDPARKDVQYIVQQTGKILVVRSGVVQTTPLIDLSDSIVSVAEQGLLGMAIPKDFLTSGQFYVNMTVPGLAMQVARFTLSSTDPLVANKASRLNILKTPRQNNNHNAGTIQFGPDGMLFVPTGDGGGSGDPDNNSQNPQSLLGKMLRIDPRSDSFPNDPERFYRIPSNNPFVDNQPIVARKEIWSFGLRNPFKFSFDDPVLLGTGALILGDVGQDAYEEIDYEPSGQGGNNYGWRRFEGFYQYSNAVLAYDPDTKPAYVYNHGTGTAVVGGRVYRGLELGADYFGRYFFADFEAGRVWSMVFFFDAVANRWKARDLREHTSQIGTVALGNVSSIDVDAAGELILVDYNGKATRLSRTNSTWIKEFTVQQGTVASGGLRSLIGSDDKTLAIVMANTSPLKSTVTVIGKTNRANPSFLDVDLVGNMSQPVNGLLRIYARRWSDNAYVQVSAQTINGTKRRFRLTGLPAATYVRSSDQRIEVRMTVERNGVSSGSLQVLWDQVVLGTR